MSTRINTQCRTNLLDTGIDTDFDSGVLEIRTGSQPATGNDAATGTLLCTVSLPADAFGSVSAGQMAKSGTWQGTAAASGTAGWFRLRNSGDTVRLDGAVGAELTLDNTSISAGGTVTISTAVITQPGS